MKAVNIKLYLDKTCMSIGYFNLKFFLKKKYLHRINIYIYIKSIHYQMHSTMNNDGLEMSSLQSQILAVRKIIFIQ